MKTSKKYLNEFGHSKKPTLNILSAAVTFGSELIMHFSFPKWGFLEKGVEN